MRDTDDPEKLVARCFSCDELAFAMHDSDINATLEYLSYCLDQGMTWLQAEKQINAYLKGKKISKDWHDKQMKRAQSLFLPWLELD